jgi:hypothetical protein
MPLIKSRLSPEQLRQGVQPDARPVAVGETDLRAILRNLTATATATAAEVLAPEQLAVGVSGGISVLIHGIRLILEARRTFVCVRLDMSNGYNACSRSVLLRRLSEQGPGFDRSAFNPRLPPCRDGVCVGWGAGATGQREVEGRGGAFWYEVPH